MALAQLGVPAGLLAVVGTDEVADRLLEQASSDGVDISAVVRRHGTENALVVDVVDGHGQWRYLEDLPHATLLTEEDVQTAAEKLAAAIAVLVQLQQPAPAALAAAHCAREAGRYVLLDGAPDETARDALLAAADIVRTDAREAQHLAGSAIPDAATALRAGRDLLRRGPRLVVLGGRPNLTSEAIGAQLAQLE
ncbi:MAG TPA: PfkB family carbohydrate kinase [Micromonospora sp.]|nr:PfkB family carbohydrate kinase [Micromonospora sp.]